VRALSKPMLPATQISVGVLRLRRTTRFAKSFCYAQDDNLESVPVVRTFAIPTLRKVREGWGTLFVACASEIKSHATSSENALALFENLAIIAQSF